MGRRYECCCIIVQLNMAHKHTCTPLPPHTHFTNYIYIFIDNIYHPFSKVGEMQGVMKLAERGSGNWATGVQTVRNLPVISESWWTVVLGIPGPGIGYTYSSEPQRGFGEYISNRSVFNRCERFTEHHYALGQPAQSQSATYTVLHILIVHIHDQGEGYRSHRESHDLQFQSQTTTKQHYKDGWPCV